MTCYSINSWLASFFIDSRTLFYLAYWRIGKGQAPHLCLSCRRKQRSDLPQCSPYSKPLKENTMAETSEEARAPGASPLSLSPSFSFFLFDQPELVTLPIKIISRALISSQSEKTTYAGRIERGVSPSSLRIYRASSSPRTVGEATHRRAAPRLRLVHALPAPIILTQPPIDRIQARRIAG